MSDVWPIVHHERRALAEDLERLSANQWACQSLCAAWDVHDVLAHLVATARTTRLGFIGRFATAGFDFHRFTANGVATERRAEPARTLAAFRAVQERTTSPPAPADSRLVEAFVHGEDIRRPLGIRHHYPTSYVARAITLQATTSDAFGGGRSRLAGVTLTATDTDFTLGTGPAVEGPAISLLLAVSGRHTALGDLTGPGVQQIAEHDTDAPLD